MSDDAQRVIREAVNQWVRQNYHDFVDAGKALDKYSDHAMRHRLAKWKWETVHPLSIEDRTTIDGFETRARMKKLYGNRLGSSINRPERHLGKDGKRYRVAAPMEKRFGKLWEDTLTALKYRSIDDREEKQRVEWSRRVVLIHWLLTDPDAHTFETILSREFQQYGWELAVNVKGKVKGCLPLWVSDELLPKEPVFVEEDQLYLPDADLYMGRIDLREPLLRDWDCWCPHIESALRVLDIGSSMAEPQAAFKAPQQPGSGMSWQNAQAKEHVKAHGTEQPNGGTNVGGVTSQDRRVLQVMVTDQNKRWSVTGVDGIYTAMTRYPNLRVGEHTLRRLLPGLAESGYVTHIGRKYTITSEGINAATSPEAVAESNPSVRRQARPVRDL